MPQNSHEPGTLWLRSTLLIAPLQICIRLFCISFVIIVFLSVFAWIVQGCFTMPDHLPCAKHNLVLQNIFSDFTVMDICFDPTVRYFAV